MECKHNWITLDCCCGSLSAVCTICQEATHDYLSYLDEDEDEEQMKRFYVEEDDNGKEIKRKLTTFANDDLTQLSDNELETLYYESSAQFLAKAMHFMKIENELFSRKNVTVSDEILINAGNNIIEAIGQVSN